MGKGGGHGGHGGHGHGYGGRGYGGRAYGRGRGRGRFHSASAECGCFKEQLIVPLIIFAIFSVIMVGILVLLVCIIPHEDGYVCNGITNISVGEQPSCRCLGSSSEYDIYIYSEKATAYQIRGIFSEPSKTAWRNYTFKYNETVQPGEYVVFNTTCGVGYNQGQTQMLLDYKLSDLANIFMFDYFGYKDFLANNDESAAFVVNRSVTHWVHFYNNSRSNVHVVVQNNGNKPITIDEKGWIYKNMYVLDASEALSVCEPGRICRYNDIESSAFFLDYDGENRTVPVEIYTSYGFNPSLIPVVTIVPVFTLPFLVLFIVFLLCYVTAESEKDLPPEEKVSQTQSSVPLEGTPTAGTEAGIMAGAGPEATPDGSATMPPPYEGETNVYGVPLG